MWYFLQTLVGKYNVFLCVNLWWRYLWAAPKLQTRSQHCAVFLCLLPTPGSGAGWLPPAGPTIKSSPGAPPHSGLICIWMRHSDTEKLHPNWQFCIFNVDICIFAPGPSPAHSSLTTTEVRISFIFVWSNDSIVNQHEARVIKMFWQTNRF